MYISQTFASSKDTDLESWIAGLEIDSSLTSVQKDSVINLVRQYHDVFSKTESDLRCCTIMTHCIRTDDVSVKLPDRRIAPPAGTGK